MQEIIVKEESNIRIDKYLSDNLKNISRMTIQSMIENGEILVNGKKVKTSYKVVQGDKIEIQEREVKESHIKPEDIPLDIVYEDDDIIVVNKQKGLVVHPGNGNPDGTLVNAIMNHCKGNLSGVGGEIRPGIVHRIDKDTSGLLIVAKNDESHMNLSEQLKNHEIKKTYLALVRGHIKESEGTIDMPIARDEKNRVKMAVDRKGKSAVTHFKVLEKFENYTYIEVNIETGRTHQIRVHMAQIGYPLVGDSVYSNGKNPFGVEGQMLHSYKLEFRHPKTGELLNLEAPLPEYFENVLNELRSNL